MWRWAAIALLIGVAIIGRGLWNATRDPIIRTATVEVADWPRDISPLNILLISDIHVAGPDMPPERLVRLVRQFSRLQPDLILIGGDLVSEKRVATHLYTPEEIAAPLSGLRARFGTVVALGNHDHWFDPARLTAELRRHGMIVLANDAVRRGPLIIGGVDDDFSGHDDLAATYAAMDALPSAPRILVTHSPDIVPDLPRPVAAVFAGHTHCGQIRLPLVGAVSYVSRYGNRFACGDMTDHGQRLFVGAGLGTSILPLRYGAPPDAWLVTLRGRSVQ